MQPAVESEHELQLEALHVVSTENERWLGSLQLEPDGRLRVVTHLAGRPTILDWDEIEAIDSAEGHPDVVWG